MKLIDRIKRIYCKHKKYVYVKHRVERHWVRKIRKKKLSYKDKAVHSIIEEVYCSNCNKFLYSYTIKRYMTEYRAKSFIKYNL